MREFLLGVLGAGMLYPVVWYQLGPERAPVAAARRVSAPPVVPETAINGVGSARSVSRAGVASPDERFEPPSVELPKLPGIKRPHAPLAAMPAALPKTLERMSELQRVAADPQALAARVQTMESNESELAELKAFAEQFVDLPPDRVQRQLSGSASPRANSRKGDELRRRRDSRP